MQVTETSAEGLKRAYAATTTAAEIDEKVNAKLEEVRPSAQLKGFRKGKVPPSILKKMFGKSVLGEVMEEIVSSTLRAHLEETGHRPVREPDVKVVNEAFEEGQDLSIEFSYEMLPEIPETPLSKIPLERLVVEVAEADVDKALGNIAENATNYEAKEGAAEDKDQLVMDFVGKIDGEAFEGGSAEDFPLVLGSGRFIPGFEEQLLGATAGEARNVEVSFPEDYSAAELAGKPALFEVTVKEVKGPVAAEIDDELAKRYGAEDLDDLKSKIRERISEEYRTAARTLMKRKLLDHLSETVSFELPPSMVEGEAKSIAHQLWHDENPDVQGHDHPEIEPTEEHVSLAERRVKLGLVLSDIGSRAGVKVSEAETNQAIAAQARNYPGHEREFMQFVQGNPQMLQQLTAPMFEDKVVDYVFELAQVADKTVSVEELQSAMEALDKDDAPAAATAET